MIIMAGGSGSGGGIGAESLNNNSEILSDPNRPSTSTSNENEIVVSTISGSGRSRGAALCPDHGIGSQNHSQNQNIGQGQGQGQQVPMDYSRFFHSLAMMNMSTQTQAHGRIPGVNNQSTPYPHPLLPPLIPPERGNSRWGFLNVSNRSFWTKYCLLCTVCGSAATILASIFLVIAALFRYYTTSIYYFETVPTYIPAILLRITACWSLVSAALASVITITTSLIHMNRLQTLRECVYNGKPSPPSCTCLAHTLSFDSFGNSFEPVHYVFENTPDCDVIHGTLYSCLRAVFAISVVAVLLSIFLCMLLYQLIGHERKKAYWSRVRRTNSDWNSDFMACLPRPMARDRSSMMPLVMPSSMSMSMPLSPMSMSMSMPLSGGGPGGCGPNGTVLPYPHPGLFAWGPPPPYEDLSSQDHRSRQLPTTTTTTVTVNLSPTSRQASSSTRQRQPPTNFVALPPVLTSMPNTEDNLPNQNHNQNHGFNLERRTDEDYPVINVNAFSPTITSMDFTSSRLLERSNPISIISSNCNSSRSHGTINVHEEEIPLADADAEVNADADAIPSTVTPPDSFKDLEEMETEMETHCKIRMGRESKPKYRYPGDFSRDDDNDEEDGEKFLQIEMESNRKHRNLTKNISVVVASIHNTDITDKSSLTNVSATASECEEMQVDMDGNDNDIEMETCKDKKDSIESLSLSLLSESESSKYPDCDCGGNGSGSAGGSGNEVPHPNSSVSASHSNSTKNRIVRSFRLEKITSLPNSPILMNVRKFCSFRLGDKDRNERRFRSVAKLNEDRDRLDSIIISSSISNCHSNVQPPEHEILVRTRMVEPKKKTLCALDSSQSR